MIVERRRPSLLHITAITALLVSSAVIAALFWMVVRDPVRFTARSPVTVLTPVVRAGHSVTLLVDYCKEGEDIATIGTIRARRGVMVPLSLWPSDLPVGCHKVAVTLPIPAYVSENVYVLYMVREYRPSIFVTHGISVPSVPFKVLGYDGSPPAPIPFVPDYEDPKFDTGGPLGDAWSH
jgi:hypothetical protein